MKSPILIITGPTATGKTNFALDLAAKFSGELISADSRQVYIGLDIVTGKDIPKNSQKVTSSLIWHNHPLTYFTDGHTKIWLTDVVHPDEPFNVSFWKECADLVITDILSRHKLPIVVGGTGLYIRALTQNLSRISVPHNPVLRNQLSKLSTTELFNYLNSKDSDKTASLNNSDAQNPRRLIRAIEISEYKNKIDPSPRLGEGLRERYKENMGNLLLGLSAPKSFLIDRIADRVDSRLAAGAIREAKDLLSQYSPDLPSLSACGYSVLTKDNSRTLWITAETQYLKRQFTWFAKMPGIHWFDITVPGWQPQAEKLVISWYNHPSVSQA